MPRYISFRVLRRFARSRFLSLLTFGLLLVTLADLSSVLTLRHSPLRRLEAAKTQSPDTRRVYIASQHWNNGVVLQSHWNAAIVELVKYFGPDNVYVSIYESGSWDSSKAILQNLDEQLETLKVRRTVILDPRTHADEIEPSSVTSGWIQTPRGRSELRRIPYLANIRNNVMKPMYELAQSGETFDSILFINDVVFTTSDIVTLLDTNGGDFAAACSLDFAKPPVFYDTFALRDAEGHAALMQTWPYFRSRASRNALMKNEPVPVRSCWNGIVAFDAGPFYNQTHPLAFRGIPDSLATSHLEASECCLIHADNPLSQTAGVWLNPNVKVGYSGAAYETITREGTTGSALSMMRAIWSNRLSRWFAMDGSHWWYVRPRLRSWESGSKGNHESGEFCMINEMHVLIANGWAHLK